jgi:hypothetical protein
MALGIVTRLQAYLDPLLFLAVAVYGSEQLFTYIQKARSLTGNRIAACSG